MVSELVSKRIAVVIPAYNEAKTVSEVIRDVSKYAMAIVVDDGSRDNTGGIAKLAGAEVVTHKFNRGYDRSLESGLRRAIELDYEYVVTIDADGQHDPDLLKKFVTALNLDADVVVGVRDKFQRWSEKLFALVSKNVWNIKDPLCGMKGYRISFLKKLNLLSSYESIGTEIVILAYRLGLNILEVPIQTKPRIGISRFGGGVKANIRIIRALINAFLKRRKIL